MISKISIDFNMFGTFQVFYELNGDFLLNLRTLFSIHLGLLCVCKMVMMVVVVVAVAMVSVHLCEYNKNIGFYYFRIMAETSAWLKAVTLAFLFAVTAVSITNSQWGKISQMFHSSMALIFKILASWSLNPEYTSLTLYLAGNTNSKVSCYVL